jgi:ADP-heptose:LPS heptosyltransferase
MSSMSSDPFSPGLLTRLSQPPRKVVLLRASRIGDFLCTIPAFRALQAALPEAEITIITLPMLRDLAVRSPYFNHFAPFPGFPGIAEQLFEARRTLDFLRQMQDEHFDLAIQLQGSGVHSNPFMLLLGARFTAGFVRQGDPAGRLDAALPVPEGEHEVRRMLALTTFLGASPCGEQTEFPLWPEDHAEAQTLLAGLPRPLIGLHTSARDATRRWPLERFARVGAVLGYQSAGAVVILCEEEERAMAEDVAGQIREAGGICVNLAGKTTLPVLGAVIARLAVFITNDTGPAHIAYALGVPTVTIAGGGNPDAYRPLVNGPFRFLAHDVPCRPCGYATCPIGAPCLEGVTVQHVLDAAREVINGEALL